MKLKPPRQGFAPLNSPPVPQLEVTSDGHVSEDDGIAVLKFLNNKHTR